MKKVILAILLVTTISIFAQETKEGPKEGWTKKGTFTLLFNQSAFSNWVSGGDNSFAGNIGLNYDFNYKNGSSTWDNKIIASYGLTNNKSSQFAKKTDDRFEFNSIYGKKASGYWSYSAFLNFKTQFTKGYVYGNDINGKEIRTEYTNFMSPGYLSFGPGMMWKKNDNLRFNLAPVSARFVFVYKNMTLPNAAYFGVDEGKSMRFEFGFNASAYAKYNVMENVSIEHILNLYSNYLDKPQNIDIDYTMNVVMTINKYLSTNLAFQTIYDDNAYKGFQVREVFGLGINYGF